MKIYTILGVAIMACACQDSTTTDVTNDYTGNESIYALQAGSVYDVDGTVTFKERNDGATDVVIAVSGTEGNLKNPVHLHLGDVTTDGAKVAALLNPVNGKTGISNTRLTMMADETTITYQQLIKLNACIKIHLSDSGPEQDIVLAGGNIGEAAAKSISNGRLSIGVCKSN